MYDSYKLYRFQLFISISSPRGNILKIPPLHEQHIRTLVCFVQTQLPTGGARTAKISSEATKSAGSTLWCKMRLRAPRARGWRPWSASWSSTAPSCTPSTPSSSPSSTRWLTYTGGSTATSSTTSPTSSWRGRPSCARRCSAWWTSSNPAARVYEVMLRSARKRNQLGTCVLAQLTLIEVIYWGAWKYFLGSLFASLKKLRYVQYSLLKMLKNKLLC